MSFIDEENQNYTIYPKRENIFKAFELTPFEEVRVVIFGQDPYSTPNQAMGLAFSVPENEKIPPSLRNIFKEIEIEFNKSFENKSGDLTYLAKQGVLLLNPILTVREKAPLSHDIKEYKLFTKDIINAIETYNGAPVVYILFGNKAKQYKFEVIAENHIFIETSHPSPLSANQGGWFNSNVFKNTNKFLKENGEKEINWLK